MKSSIHIRSVLALCLLIPAFMLAALPASAAELPRSVAASTSSGEEFVHTATSANTQDNWTAIDHPLANGNPNIILHVTQNWNPGGSGNIYNDHAIGVWYVATMQKWAIFNQDRQPMPEGASFNVFVTPASPDAAVHTATAGNIQYNWTPIDHPAANNNPNAIVHVTQNWNPGGNGGVYNDHVVGVWYVATMQKWAIFNQDRQPMTENASFNVVVSQPSEGVFVHTAGSDNITANWTAIDHPQANDNPDAILHVTQNWNPGGTGGVYNDHPIGVFYNPGIRKWAVFNQDREAMPAGASFNVAIVPEGSGEIDISLPTDATPTINGPVRLPLTLGSTVTGRDIYAYEFELSYDSGDIQFAGASTDGTVSAGWQINQNELTPGHLYVAASGTQPLAGEGTLLQLDFQVIGRGGEETNVVFERFQFNEGEPASRTVDGRVRLQPLTLAGTLTHLFSGSFISGATMTLSGASSDSTVSNGGGLFQVDANVVGAHQLTPDKQGDLRGAVTALDAAYILEHLVQKRVLSAAQLRAADVSQDGAVTAYDAGLISRYLVGLTEPASATGQWLFTPQSRTYHFLGESLTGQDFMGQILGDISGNWGVAARSAQLRSSLPLHVGQVNGLTGDAVTVPVSLNNGLPGQVQAFQFELTYDPTVLTVEQVLPGAHTGEGWQFLTHEQAPGRLRVVGFSATPLAAGGEVLQLQARLLGSAGASTDLTVEALRLNEDEPQPDMVIGDVTVAPGQRIFLPLTTR